MLLESHIWTEKTSLEDRIADAVAKREDLLNVATEFAEKVSTKAKIGVYLCAVEGGVVGRGVRAV